jgi:hypothetical protein
MKPFPPSSIQTIWLKLWWRYMPGTIIKVRWPRGDVIIDENHPKWDWTVGPSLYRIESADPNDHYRPDLEEKIGHQGWDWHWILDDRDVIDNCLTIKIRKKHAKWASYFSLKWT